MRVISRGTLRDYWLKEPASKTELEIWFDEARSAKWGNPAELKSQYRSASILKGGRAVFNICGNKYRLVVAIRYDLGIVFIRFVGTHREYDAINAETI